MSNGDEPTAVQARQFIAAINSDYFHDVFVALRIEFSYSDEAQGEALDKLEARLFAICNLLKQRLEDVPVEK
jgi:hypothetical protein